MQLKEILKLAALVTVLGLGGVALFNSGRGVSTTDGDGPVGAGTDMSTIQGDDGSIVTNEESDEDAIDEPDEDGINRSPTDIAPKSADETDEPK